MLGSEIHTILLVDDNLDHVELITVSLKRTFPTAKLIKAYDGEAALQLLGMFEDASIEPKISPEIILLDINLPKYSGFEVLRNIRFHNRYKDTLILAISTSSSKTDIDLMLELGADDYYIKSQSCLDIGDAVILAMQRHRLLIQYQISH
jgi:DNA-binding response OmpR family regulator